MYTEMLELLSVINPLLLFYIMLFGLIYINRYIKLQKEKNEQDKMIFTRDEVFRIKSKIDSFTETKKNEFINRYIKTSLMRNYNDDLEDLFFEIMNDLDMLCEGIIKEIYSEKYVSIYLKNKMIEYNNDAKKINAISSQEMFVSLDIVLNRWKNNEKGIKK